jgi:hypothetical protein
MKCPHCLVSFHEKWEEQDLDFTKKDGWLNSRHSICPECERIIVQLGSDSKGWHLVYPKGVSRTPIPTEVEDPVVIADYKESCLTLVDSSKASAALSRRLMQYILREYAGVKHSTLYNEIQEVIDSNKYPSELTSNLDVVRAIGNFAAHAIKSTNSGEIVDVEPGEAEWNLDVLEELIDYFFVRPARIKKKKEALNEKLRDAGKDEVSL